MKLLNEVSSTVIKNTYKVFTKLLFNNDSMKGEQIMTIDNRPVLVAGGAKQTVNQYCERALAELFFRNGADRRFEPGAARIAIAECGWNPLDENNDNRDSVKMGRLKVILEYISKNYNDREKISNDLNGKTYDELYASLSNEIKKAQELENQKLNNLTDKKNDHEYKIVRIDSFDESKKYYELTNPNSRWCLTYSRVNYSRYTNRDKYAMYFCLRDDIETVPYKVGEGCPLDEYGKSMLCIIVDQEGNLVTFTTRWNHKDATGKRVPADTGVGDKVTVSEIVGVNFNEVFKPYTEEELETKLSAHKDQYSFESLTENDSAILSNVQQGLETLYEDLLSEYDEEDPDSFNPDDETWAGIMEHIDWDWTRIFGDDMMADIDEESTSAHENMIFLKTATGYCKIFAPMQPEKKFTNWCDSILPVYTFKSKYNYTNRIFAIKEHNADFYKFITINTSRAEIEHEIETNFDNKFKCVLEKERLDHLMDDSVLLLGFTNNTIGQVVFNGGKGQEKVTITKQNEARIPENYIAEETAIKIFGHLDNALYQIKNNTSGKYNIIYAANNFKLELKPEYECDYVEKPSKYQLNYKTNDDSKKFVEYNTPLYVAYKNNDQTTHTILDPKTLQPIFDKNSDIINSTDIHTFTRIINYTPIESNIKNNFGKYDLEIHYYTKDGDKITKLSGVYCNRDMIWSFFAKPEKLITMDPIGLVFEDQDCTKIIIFNTNNNILYKSNKIEPELRTLEPKDITYLHVEWKYNAYAKDHLCISINTYSTRFLQIDKKDLNLQNESFTLKYAAYLLS